MLERYGVELIGAKLDGDQEGRGPRPLQGGDASASASTCRAAATRTRIDGGARRSAREIGLPLIIRAVAHARRHGRRRRRQPTRSSSAIVAAGLDGVADPRGADRGVDRGLEGVRARGDARRARTTSSSSARSRTSTRWACTPATRITVAPAQTLTDKEYQIMRDAAIAHHPRDRRRDRRLEHPVRASIPRPAGWSSSR